MVIALLLVVLLTAIPQNMLIVTPGELRKRHIQLVGVKARPASDQTLKNCYTTSYAVTKKTYSVG
jgi:hypothetical protein